MELKKMNILIIEDNQIQQRVLTDFFGRLNMTSFIANNGQEGLDFIKSTKEKIDFIFTDVKMPVMGGVEFVEEFRKTDSETPIVLMTANYELHNKNTISGINESIIKPFDLDVIYNIFCKYFDIIDHPKNKMAY
jgi:CheY-like chemotaxis protein